MNICITCWVKTMKIFPFELSEFNPIISILWCSFSINYLLKEFLGKYIPWNNALQINVAHIAEKANFTFIIAPHSHYKV